MPTLHWIGKDKVVNHHQDVPYRILEHKYGFSAKGGEQKGIETESGNKIIHGDNLEALKALLPQYEGQIKCIYIDPPYNTGNENWVYNDNVNDPKIKKWLQKVVGKEGEDLSRHDKWLCMMYPRLKLLHKLLKDNGAIFISLDENEAHHARCILNEIFGEKNFIAQITLLTNPKGRSQDKYFSTNHEYCLVYSKSELMPGSFSVTKGDELIAKEYKLSDKGGKYRLLELRNTHREFNKTNRPNLFFPLYINPINGCIAVAESKEYNISAEPLWNDGFEGCWTWGKDLAQKDSHLLYAIKSRGKWKVYRKDYAIKSDGESASKKLFTIWHDARFYTEKGQINFGEIFPGFNKNDFPQPKSVDFIKEIIRTSTDEDSIILDSFAGSGTTGNAVLSLNQETGGKRRFILIELADYAETITVERIKRVINGYGENKGIENCFDFYSLGMPLFKEDRNLNEEVHEDKIREYIYYSETKQPLKANGSSKNEDNKYYLNEFNGTGYYFFYEKESLTTLDNDFLTTIKTVADQYIIYADNCLLDKSFMQAKNIIFKKIPRDITRF